MSYLAALHELKDNRKLKLQKKEALNFIKCLIDEDDDELKFEKDLTIKIKKHIVKFSI